MKKNRLNLLTGLIFALIFSACLKDEPIAEIHTYEEEQVILSAFLDTLAAQGNDIDTTDLGVYYIVLDEGEGAFAKETDTLVVGYAAYFTDGTLFDASEKYNQNGLEFVLGNPPLIKGWDDGMKVMNKNARVQFIIPSSLAYKEVGSGVIPPYKTLVFVMRMLEIRPVLEK